MQRLTTQIASMRNVFAGVDRLKEGRKTVLIVVDPDRSFVDIRVSATSGREAMEIMEYATKEVGRIINGTRRS